MRDYDKSEVLEILGLRGNDRQVGVEIDWNGAQFRDLVCHADTMLPAAILVDYYDTVTVDYDRDIYEPGTLHQVALSLQHAPRVLREIFSEAFDDDNDYALKLVVNGWALAYGQQVAA